MIAVSDANFERYGIHPEEISRVFEHAKVNQVNLHLILIASLQDSAQHWQKKLPQGRVHLCMESTDLPSIFRQILSQSGSLVA